tara:strand:- start:210 stop:386 length:177 start_codon:yes stop_codon:yes gene_type:complete
MDKELKALHGKIAKLAGKPSSDAAPEVGRMSAGEHKMLAKARESFGPRNGRDWRKAAV